MRVWVLGQPHPLAPARAPPESCLIRLSGSGPEVGAAGHTHRGVGRGRAEARGAAGPAPEPGWRQQPQPAPLPRGGAPASHRSRRSSAAPRPFAPRSTKERLPASGAAATRRSTFEKYLGLEVALHLPARRPGEGRAGVSGCRARSPGSGALAGARSQGGLGAREGDRATAPQPPPSARRHLPAPTEAPGLLTSDSRRWLRNTSRPLGDACFPLPPPLPLPLAGGLPAPGAPGSSMRLRSGAPLSCSALSARGDPAAARCRPGPAP